MNIPGNPGARDGLDKDGRWRKIMELGRCDSGRTAKPLISHDV